MNKPQGLVTPVVHSWAIYSTLPWFPPSLSDHPYQVSFIHLDAVSPPSFLHLVAVSPPSILHPDAAFPPSILHPADLFFVHPAGHYLLFPVSCSPSYYLAGLLPSPATPFLLNQHPSHNRRPKQNQSTSSLPLQQR